MSRWFRHYAGMARDEKIVRAALKAGQSIERAAWVWAAILESAAEIDDGGRFELDAAEVAYFLRAEESDIAGIMAALEDGGRIAGDRVVKWSDRQFQSDRSAERQRRHRDKQKATRDAGGEPCDEEVHRHGDGHVTSPSRHGDAPETETETDIPIANAIGASAPRDERQILFQDGLAGVRRLTGKPEPQVRRLIGRWLKQTGDDCVAVRRVIEDAERDRPADPVAWIEAHFRPRPTGPPGEPRVMTAI